MGFRPRGRFNVSGHGAKRGFGGGGGNRGRGYGGRRPRPNLDIADFIARAQQSIDSGVSEEKVGRFENFELHSQLLGNIRSLGYEQPTPIQDKTIPVIMEGKDLVGLANTGTGKTASFLIPLINRLAHDPKHKALIMAPTRELAMQIEAALRSLKPGFKIWSVLCIGGTSMYRQLQELRRPYEVVIGTPGRLKDLAGQGALDLSGCRTVVLDEVDRMMDMGFLPDMRELLGMLPDQKQSLFFSATLSGKIHSLATTFMKDPVTVSVKTQEVTGLVEQSVMRVRESDKLDRLLELLMSKEYEKVLVFGRTKRGVKELMFKLRDRGVRAESIHGNKSQNYRKQALQAFRSNMVNVLVATDVAARGLDVADITHVINYDMPETYDDYVHRIGRTGRAGRKGIAVTFVAG